MCALQSTLYTKIKQLEFLSVKQDFCTTCRVTDGGKIFCWSIEVDKINSYSNIQQKLTAWHHDRQENICRV